LALCCLVLAGCNRAPPEQRLRGEIARMQHALEQRQADVVMEGVAQDFYGEGGLDRDMLHRTMALRMLANARVGVSVGPLDVALRQGQATVRFQALLTGGDGRWLPDQAQAYDVVTTWRDETGEWRLVSAEWTARL
jgi:hypothetical protein